jgi:Na+/H+-dicarboxylate symporter
MIRVLLVDDQALVFGIPLSFTALITGVLLGPTTAQRLDGNASAWFRVAAESLTVALLLGTTWLSVFKPGGRLRGAAGG